MRLVSLPMDFDLDHSVTQKLAQGVNDSDGPGNAATNRQAIFERLLQRQHIRHQLGIKPLNIAALYRRKVREAEQTKLMQK